jgi:nitric oxide reductase subunit B
MTYAMPYLLGRKPYNQVLNMVSFWVMSSGMAFMTFTLTFAGVVQTHLQRVLGQGYMDTQDQLQLFYVLRLGSGAVVVLGALLYLWSIFGPVKPELVERDASAAPAE